MACRAPTVSVAIARSSNASAADRLSATIDAVHAQLVPEPAAQPDERRKSAGSRPTRRAPARWPRPRSRSVSAGWEDRGSCACQRGQRPDRSDASRATRSSFALTLSPREVSAGRLMSKRTRSPSSAKTMPPQSWFSRRRLADQEHALLFRDANDAVEPFVLEVRDEDRVARGHGPILVQPIDDDAVGRRPTRRGRADRSRARTDRDRAGRAGTATTACAKATVRPVDEGEEVVEKRALHLVLEVALRCGADTGSAREEKGAGRGTDQQAPGLPRSPCQPREDRPGHLVRRPEIDELEMPIV